MCRFSNLLANIVSQYWAYTDRVLEKGYQVQAYAHHMLSNKQPSLTLNGQQKQNYSSPEVCAHCTMQ